MFKIINPATDSISDWKMTRNGAVQSVEKFRVILIGLDGGIKIEKVKAISKEELFQKIDAMPMRIREIKNRQ